LEVALAQRSGGTEELLGPLGDGGASADLDGWLDRGHAREV
jgi:uncharacterized protein YidB (DUF937 family)